MKNYVVIRLHGEQIEETAGGATRFTAYDAEKLARNIAKSGISCSVYEEKMRFKPAEPDVEEAR